MCETVCWVLSVNIDEDVVDVECESRIIVQFVFVRLLVY